MSTPHKIDDVLKNQQLGPRAASLAEIAAILCDGETDAVWTQFVALAHPLALAICRRRALRREAPGRGDLHGDAALRAIELSRKNDFAALGRFCEARRQYPQLTFEAWFSTIVTHAHIDIVRGQPEAQRRRAEDGTRRTSFIKTVRIHQVESPNTGAVRAVMPIERVIELRRILATLQQPDFPSNQRRALVLWLGGHGAGEIADVMQLSESAARRLLRAARARLRRKHLGGK